MLLRPASSDIRLRVRGANGSPALNLPRPSVVPTVTELALLMLVHVRAATKRISWAGSMNTSLPLASMNLPDHCGENVGLTWMPMCVNGGHQLKAYERDSNGVLTASTLS